MKYIRTKDGHIYKIWKDTGVDGFIAKGEITTRNGEHIGSFKGFVPVGYDKIIAQEDTIEELVDELVVVEPNNEDCPRPYILDCFYLCTYNSWFEREKEHIETGTIIVYGEIWVNGELRKVAKMNEKGELELL